MLWLLSNFPQCDQTYDNPSYWQTTGNDICGLLQAVLLGPGIWVWIGSTTMDDLISRFFSVHAPAAAVPRGPEVQVILLTSFPASIPSSLGRMSQDQLSVAMATFYRYLGARHFASSTRMYLLPSCSLPRLADGFYVCTVLSARCSGQ